LAFAVLPPEAPIVPVPPRSEEVYPLLKVNPVDLEKPLVSYRDRVITMADYSDYYDKSSHFVRPKREYRLGGVKKFLLDIVMNDLIPIEMEESNIENEPEIAEVMRKKKEEFMVNKLYLDLVQDQTLVTYREMKEHYNANIVHYRVPEARRFGLVLTPDKAGAEEAYQKILNGVPFARVVAEYSTDQQSKANDGSTEFLPRGEQPEIDEIGFSLNSVGDLSEPFEISRGWAVVKLLERKPERTLPMEEVESSIRHTLKSIKDEQRLNELLAKWKEDIPIKVYEKNLMKADLDRTQEKKKTPFGRA
jgi:peptidyl-prolyl cis-trans isomerase C